MKKLFTIEEFNSASSTCLLPLECYRCKKTFFWLKKHITYALNGNKKVRGMFCSISCGLRKNNVFLNCETCQIQFERSPSQLSSHNFCSHSCAATFNNKNKTTGTRRSKLESWIEEQLTNHQPNMNILYNSVGLCGYEFDILIKDLKLAIELNGIVHYKPIYGQKTYEKILRKDHQKVIWCRNNSYNLLVIDVSNIKQFSIESSKPILETILKFIGRAHTT